MVRMVLVFGLGFGLMSCGVEGDPLRPTAQVGIGIGPSGVGTNFGVGVQNSNLSLQVGGSR